MSSVLIIDGEPEFRSTAVQALAGAGYRVTTAASADEGARAWSEGAHAVVLIGSGDGARLLETLAQGAAARAAGALFILALARAGSAPPLSPHTHDLLYKPLQPDELISKIRNAVELRRLRQRVRAPASDADEALFLTRSPAMEQVLNAARELASQPAAPILLEGERGAGKEALARFIHARTPRRADEPFSAVNCAAGAGPALERGALDLACGGTLFLDAVEVLDPALQPRLLQLLDAQEADRSGASSAECAPPRLIAASHDNLLDAVKAGRFRLDLYHRLAAHRLAVPPLRERREDLIPLARALLHTLSLQLARAAPQLSVEAERKLLAYRFPGNLREPRNALERALVISRAASLGAAELSLGAEHSASSSDGQGEPFLDLRLSPGGAPPTLAQVEKLYVEEVLKHTRSNRTQAARLMGVSYPTVIKKIADYRIRLCP